MIKIYIKTTNQKKWSIPIPNFLFGPIIHFTFSDFLWKFVKKQAQDQTINTIYLQLPLIKEMLKVCSQEIKTCTWLNPLVECSLKDGTYLKIEIH